MSVDVSAIDYFSAVAAYGNRESRGSAEKIVDALLEAAIEDEECQHGDTENGHCNDCGEYVPRKFRRA